VFDAKVSSRYNRDQILVLPHGDKGTLPNLDLITAAIYSLQKIMKSGIKVQVHPYDALWWEQLVTDHLPQHYHEWGRDLGNMIAFMAAFRKPPPHAPALAEGIDSLTIQAQFKPHKDDRIIHPDVLSTMEVIEHLIRGMNDLNERLHHNTNQFTMPSSTKFVSHTEYILPMILILLPLAFRVVKIISQDLEHFVFGAALNCMFGTFLLSSIMVYVRAMNADTADRLNSIIIAVFVCIIFLGRWTMLKVECEQKNELQSIQVVACLLALYVHVPIVLSNISLATPSALFWVPLLAFPDYGNTTILKRMLGGLLIVTTFVGSRTGNISLPLYACTVLVPLHFLFVILCIG